MNIDDEGFDIDGEADPDVEGNKGTADVGIGEAEADAKADSGSEEISPQWSSIVYLL